MKGFLSNNRDNYFRKIQAIAENSYSIDDVEAEAGDSVVASLLCDIKNRRSELSKFLDDDKGMTNWLSYDKELQYDIDQILLRYYSNHIADERTALQDQLMDLLSSRVIDANKSEVLEDIKCEYEMRLPQEIRFPYRPTASMGDAL